MKIRILIQFVTIVVLICTLFGFYYSPEAAVKKDESSCNVCHYEYRTLLPDDHHDVDKGETAHCLVCHKPQVSGDPSPNVFSALIHGSHSDLAECLDCHPWKEDGAFELPRSGGTLGKPSNEDMEWIKESFSTWVESPFLDAIHGEGHVTCSGCHGENLPLLDATVRNERCLACHGPMESLVEKTRPEKFPDRNPHESHLGEIACTVCHHAHFESEVYCLGCHGDFEMSIPGGP